MKLALGTVQFGLAYGEFNRGGKVPAAEVERILALAHARGVSLLDTAQAYGESEAILGRLGAGNRFKLVTKISPLRGSDDALTKARAAIEESLNRLRVAEIHGLLLHRAADLLEDRAQAVWSLLWEMRERGIVRRVGVSAYGLDEASAVLRRFPIELIQIPLNVFDTRYLDSGFIGLCRSRGVEVHARSVFLQGFILSPPDSLTGHLAKYRPLLAKFQAVCAQHDTTPLQAALRYALGLPQIEQVVVGVESTQQLAEILESATGESLPHDAIRALSCSDPDLVDPSRWH